MIGVGLEVAILVNHALGFRVFVVQVIFLSSIFPIFLPSFYFSIFPSPYSFSFPLPYPQCP